MEDNFIYNNMLDNNALEKVEKVLGQSVYEDKSGVGDHIISTFYDQYNSKTIVKRKISNELQYDIYENTYDEYGNITIINHSVIYGNKLVTSDSKTFYEYKYNSRYQIMLTIKYNENHEITHKKEYEYNGNRVLKMYEYYDNGNYKDFKLPRLVHTYYYNSDGDVVKVEVSDGSGNRLYYRILSVEKENWTVVNPFKTRYSWLIEIVDADNIVVKVCEDTLRCDIIEEIVENLLHNYPMYNWFLISATCSRVLNKEEEENISKLTNDYKEYRNVQINFI